MAVPKDPPKRGYVMGQCLKYELDPQEFFKATYELPKTCTDISMQGTPIQEFYNGAHVLITGGTGFMGKTLIEKLLVSCPKLAKLYLVIREKKGQTMEERFDDLFNNDVFKRLKKMVPDFRKKVEGVNGDCSLERLGLSDADYKKLQENVTVVFHGAATVRFDEKIRIATQINIKGVREMLKFCRQCTNLKSMVHISTAYANCLLNKWHVDEKFYPAAYDYKTLIKLVETESDEVLEKMTPKLLEPWPNSYSFTKQIAEDVIRREGDGLPVCMFRPAIIVATYKEPMRGWCDNIYGPTGIILGAATGVLRVMQGDTSNVANVVPVDTSINALIAIAWNTYENHKKEQKSKIYNYVSTRNPQTWHEFHQWNEKYGRRWPTMLSIWYPILFTIQNRFIFLIAAFFLHTIPAYFADMVLYITGHEPKLIKGYKKINKFLNVLQYFCINGWNFTDTNTLTLWNNLSSQDKEIFFFDMGEVNWDYFSQGHLLGLRYYLAKDPLDTLPQAKAKYKRLMLLHCFVCLLLSIFAVWLISKVVGWSFFSTY